MTTSARVAIIADSHFDEGSRWEEGLRIHDWIVRDLELRGVDLILHAGDVFERKSTARERLEVARFLTAAASLAPVVVVRGNHDALEDLAIFGKLETRHPVIVEEAAAVHVVAGVAVACLAWPRKASLLAATGDTGKEAGERSAGDALRNVLRGLGLQLEAHDGPRVLLSHAQVCGSRTSTGQPLVGCDLEVGLEDLALCGADFYALGHIHLPQDWTINGAPVVYPGSPRRTAYGELEEKGYVVATLEAGRPVGWDRIPTPAAPMLLIEAAYTPARGLEITSKAFPHAERVAGAEMRLRVTVDAEHRAAARSAAAELEAEARALGAVAVKVEEVVRPKSTARAPEVAAAVDLGAKLRAMWSARGLEPAPEVAARLVSKALELEGEAIHAA